MRSRSVLSFYGSFGTSRIRCLSEFIIPGGGDHGFPFPYLFLVVSCFYLVLDVQLCLLCLYIVVSVGGGIIFRCRVVAHYFGLSILWALPVYYHAR